MALELRLDLVCAPRLCVDEYALTVIVFLPASQADYEVCSIVFLIVPAPASKTRNATIDDGSSGRRFGPLKNRIAV